MAPDFEYGVYAAGGIADEVGIDAQRLKHTYRKGDFLHGVALVVVEAALHGIYLAAAETSYEQAAVVSFDG